jgi:hypothetical protein
MAMWIWFPSFDHDQDGPVIVEDGKGGIESFGLSLLFGADMLLDETSTIKGFSGPRFVGWRVGI